MSQKTNSMIKLALVFFISLLSFSIGTYIGKKYSDNQHQLALLEPNQKPTHEANVNTEFATQADEKNKMTEPHGLSDSEVAKIAEEFAADETAAPVEQAEEKLIPTTEQDEKPIKTVQAIPAKAAQAKPVKSLTQAAAQQIEKMQNSERQPASKPAVANTAMQFTVQVGSFPTETEAQKMTKDLQAKGFKTTFAAAAVNGQTWYRVNVGLFGSVKEAQDYKKDFLEKTKLTSAIVIKVQ